MSCPTCLGRKTLALDLFPCRRPLFVRCRPCKDKRRARWHVASRIGIVLASAAFAIALASGRLFDVARQVMR